MLHIYIYDISRLRVNTHLSIWVCYVQFLLVLDTTDHSADLNVSKVTPMFEIF